MSKKQEKTCTRCNVLKFTIDFIKDSEMPDVCRECFTDEELNNYTRSDLSKALLDLRVKQKQKVIRNLIHEFKKNREKLNVL